jgi:uroporphyrinogen decarboxylase
MRPEQWEAFKKVARHEAVDAVPLAVIIDSPWIPATWASGT